MKKGVTSIGLLVMLCGLLVGCSGGSGEVGDDYRRISESGSVILGSVLTFKSPESFVNGRIHETTRSGVDVQGELSSPPTLDCSSGQTTPPSNTGRRIRWRNLATGERGETDSYVGCYNTGTIFGTGIKSYWSIGFVSLAIGMNEFEFLTFGSDGKQVGEDIIRIRRLDTEPPVYRYPADGEENVPVDRPVLVVFSEPMNSSSLDPSGLTLTEVDGDGVAGVLDYDHRFDVWQFAPHAELAPDTLYEVRLSGRVKATGGAGDLGEELAWQFRTGLETDDSNPEIVNRWPDMDGCDCAEITTRIYVGFGEPMDAWAIGADALTLTSEISGRVPAQVHFRGDHLELVPESPLSPDTEHRVSLADGMLDSTARPLGVGISWTFRTGSPDPVGTWNVLAEPPVELGGASGVWMDDAWFVWGRAWKADAPCTSLEPCAGQVIGLGLIYEPASDTWAEAAFEMEQYDAELGWNVLTPFPELRRAPSLVWTGDEVLLFAGYRRDDPATYYPECDCYSGVDDGSDGGAYDPVADAWRSMSDMWRAPGSLTSISFDDLVGQSSLWTGSEMLMWGGEYENRSAMEPINRGWRYHPTFNRWLILGDEESVDSGWNLLPDTDPLAADARTGHAAVWTGEEMIVWGGRGAEDEVLSRAGRYHLEDAAWREISSDGSAPGSPGDVIAVWTGERMIAWNGGSRARNPLAMRTVELRTYDPVQNRWQASAAGWEPQFLAGAPESNPALVNGRAGRLKAFWTGSVLLVVGVEDSKEQYESDPGGWVDQATVAAYLYDPTLDRWQSGGSIQATVARSERGSFEAAWTGDALLVLLGNQLYQFTPPGT